MSLYSTLFWQGELPTTETTIYTVAAGDLIVLRDAEYLNSSSGPENIQVQTTVPGFDVAVACRVNSVPSGEGAQWQGRVVVPAGGSLQVAGAAAGLYLILSGYLFTT